MILNAKKIDPFVCGDLEIRNLSAGYLYRGHIKSLVIKDEVLKVELEWLVINDGCPNNPTETWTKSVDGPYVVMLGLQAVFDIRGRIIFDRDMGDIVVLFPAKGDLLDVSCVVGL